MSERDELASSHGFVRGPGTRAHAGLAVAPRPLATAAAAFAVIEWTVWGLRITLFETSTCWLEVGTFDPSYVRLMAQSDNGRTLMPVAVVRPMPLAWHAVIKFVAGVRKIAPPP